MLKWMEYLGLNLIDVPQSWINRFKIKDLKNIHLLDVENLECKGKINIKSHPGMVDGTFRRYTSDCSINFLDNSKSRILVPRVFDNSFNMINSKLTFLFDYNFVIEDKFNDFYIYKKINF